jgi:peptidoglycan/xylan/chitin deacetylase (PgdA/CDA1 family)
VKNAVVNWFDPPILILAYHRIADLKHDPQSLAVRPVNFRAQMRHLKERYQLLHLGEAWPRRERPAAIVTFDDGYADNAQSALPILEEEKVPATFFVSVGAVKTGREFWWDELERWLLLEPPPPNPLEIVDALGRSSWRTGTREERTECYQALHTLLRPLPPVLRDRWLDALRAACGGSESPRASHRPLSAAEVARLGNSAVATVGAHGVTHTPFSSLTLPEQRDEMKRSRDQLRAWGGGEIETFSFPFGGRRDFTSESIRVAREVGFLRIAANVPGQVHRWTESQALPRFLVRDWDREQFALELNRFQTV